MPKVPDENLQHSAAIVSWFGFILAIATFVIQGMYQLSGPTVMNWRDRVSIIVWLGLLAGMFYGFLWAMIAQKIIFQSNFGEDTSLPTGWHAVALSLSLTLPVTFLPPLYQLITGTIIISSPHFIYAAVFANVASAFGHVIWYGIKTLQFAGIRNMTFPIGAPPNWKRYMTMEALATCMHFLSTVLVFRVLADNQDSLFGRSAVILPTILSGLFFFFGICSYSLIKYPQSLSEGSWAQVRGFLAGMLLCIGLTGGILM